MKSTPDPAFCFVTSIHTDITKAFHRIEQTRDEEAKTGLAAGAIGARQAASFREDKLALHGEQSSNNTGSSVAVSQALSKNAS